SGGVRPDAGSFTSDKALTCRFIPNPSAPERDHIPPAADAVQVARLAAGGMPVEGRRMNEECRRQRRYGWPGLIACGKPPRPACPSRSPESQVVKAAGALPQMHTAERQIHPIQLPPWKRFS